MFCLWEKMKITILARSCHQLDFLTMWLHVSHALLKTDLMRICTLVFTSLLKTLWEKKKSLVMSNFSFSHSVSYPFRKTYTIFIKFKIMVRKLSQFGSLKFVVWESVNSFPNDTILDWTKLEAFADGTLNFAKMMISFSNRVENIVSKGENAGFPQCFQKIFFF